MRVLTVTNMYPTSTKPSFGAFVKSQVESLVVQGHDIEVLFIDGTGSKWNYMAGFDAVSRAVERFQPDVIHAHYGLSGFVAAYPRRSQPLVLSLCGDDVLGTPTAWGGLTLLSRLGTVLSRRACVRSAAIIVKSEEMRNVVARWGYSGATVIPTGVDISFFKPPTLEERRAARSRLELSTDSFQVLFPHTPYERRKRVDLAEQVVRLLGDNAQLQIVYHRPKDVLRDYYYAADVMILTSEWEGSPNVVKEAMACNLPTVCFNVGDVCWLSAGTQSHRVVPRYDVAAMVTSIRELVRLGVRDGYERIRRDLSAATTSVKISEIYDAVRQLC